MEDFTDVPFVQADRTEVTAGPFALLPHHFLYDKTKPSGNQEAMVFDKRIYFIVAIAVVIVQVSISVFRD
ncbi:hypothetical protein [Thalassospira mesophila]|uniref:Uncharacterized protein n=1 Tax=Thalassospira mesophila TaxID=1293891 RepID=A0A1Y2KYW4_9PROT|nr:hypothetical protein [Thalassospira mesophila]OSQ37361.1 hypothetical protein TMES_14135 [Thalassospira mesophila]